MNRDALEYYQSFAQSVKDFCKPLESYFGISLFIYGKFFKDGRYLLVTNDYEFNDFYFKNVDCGNIFFRNYITCKSIYDCIVWPSEPKNTCMEAYFNFNHWHGMQFVLDKSESYIEVAGFATHKDNPKIIDFYFKHATVLETFVHQFKQIFRNQITIPTLDNRLAIFAGKFDMYLPSAQIAKENELIDLFYYDIGIKTENSINNIQMLTHTEIKIIKYISRGYSAKDIANEFKNSPRTIEKHIQNIKQKTMLHYKSDIIKNYKDLL